MHTPTLTLVASESLQSSSMQRPGASPRPLRRSLSAAGSQISEQMLSDGNAAASVHTSVESTACPSPARAVDTVTSTPPPCITIVRSLSTAHPLATITIK